MLQKKQTGSEEKKKTNERQRESEAEKKVTFPATPTFLPLFIFSQIIPFHLVSSIEDEKEKVDSNKLIMNITSILIALSIYYLRRKVKINYAFISEM